MSLYQVIEVSEVFQNSDDKWVIGSLNKTDVFIHVVDSKTTCMKLKDKGFIDTCDMRKISISSTDKDIIEVREKRTSKPLCRLEIAKWASK